MKLPTYELRKKSKNELTKTLDELKSELSNLRIVKNQGGAASKLAKIKVVTKAIARILTVMNQAKKEQLRAFYKTKDHIPLDLRKKQTRAIRKALTPAQKKLKTLKQMKKEKHFPMRKFAVKA